MDWTKVVTDPLGIAGYALFLIFGVVGVVVARKSNEERKETPWLLPAACVLAAICVVGGLALAYHRETAATAAAVPAKQTVPAPAPAPPSMQVGTIDQKVNNGSAVAGVQGNVTVDPAPTDEGSKPKQ